MWYGILTSLRKKESDLEGVQRVALKIILKDDYELYTQALHTLNLEPLSARREALCLKFAQKCVKHEKAKELFPLNTELRNKDKYKVQFASTGRLMRVLSLKSRECLMWIPESKVLWYYMTICFNF